MYLLAQSDTCTHNTHTHMHPGYIHTHTHIHPGYIHTHTHSVGGSQPIVFAYVSEFFTEKQRGPMIILLASCWQPGIIFTGRYGAMYIK